MEGDASTMTGGQKAGFFRPWSEMDDDRSRPEDDDRASIASTSQQGSEGEGSSLGRLSDFVQRSPAPSEEYNLPSYHQQACDALVFNQAMMPIPMVNPYHQSLPIDLAQYGYAVRQVTIEEQRHRAMKKFRPKKFQCPSCRVAFSNNGQLKGHMRIHTGERPFECSEPGCGKKFTRNEELTRHKRIHTGIKPYACSMCKKSFGRKDHLKKHLKTHEPRNFYQLAAAVAGAHAYPLYPMHEALAVGFPYGL